MDSETARQVLDLAHGAGALLDRSIQKMMDNCPQEEFLEYRKAVGHIMGAIYFDILQPLYERYPDLVPPEMRPPK